ncbi:phosphotransferase family protein [Nocardioides speluncae]|uniref:phosphotransferase family protein n=1 Tax=Nocardioides speluncae TaxID=2670337 RepID=UPI00198097D2|nr:phosphotransferase family protein [Nocardioides speluncae]
MNNLPVGTELTTHSRDPLDLVERLRKWLAERLGSDGPVAVSEVRAPAGSGMSSVTVLFRANYRAHGVDHASELVLRLPPDDAGFAVFPDYDLRRQYDAMAAAAPYAPVPPLVGIEDSTDLLGAPFLVMGAVAGRAPTDNPPYVFGGFLVDAAPAERRALQDATVDLLAAVHRVPLDRLPGLVEEAGADPLRTHMDGQRAYYAWTHARDDLRVPLLERAFDWLEDHWPADTGDSVLSWGDARPGNVLYDDDLTPVAALDWEMVSVAPRGLDLGWLVLIHQFFQDIAEVFELPGLPDFCRAEDVLDRYEQASGVRVPDLDWYVVYAALRHGIVMSQIKRRMIHNGEEPAPSEPDDYVMHRALLERLIG